MINAKALEKFREKHQLTRTEMAAKIGVSAQTIWTWEKGLRIPEDRQTALAKMMNELEEAKR